MKKRTFLNGKVVFPLRAGQKAIVLHNGQRMITSVVKSILVVSLDTIAFETMNTVYTITSETAGEFVGSELVRAEA